MSFLARWFYRRAQNTTRRTPSHRPLRVEVLEERTLLSSAFRTIDGFGNNITNPTWGQAGTDLIRVSPVAYADGISTDSLAPVFLSSHPNRSRDN